MLVGFTILNGESSWLIGAMLIVAYCSLAAAFFVHKDPPGLPRPPSLPPSYTYGSR